MYAVNIFYFLILLFNPIVFAKDYPCITGKCRLTSNELKFVVIGDWGGTEIWPHYSAIQLHVSEALETKAKKEKIDFIASVGDNFYFLGVQDADSPRFKETFENVFNGENLKKVPWYIVAGNHDHYGKVQGQIDYSEKSKRWNFPNEYYTVHYVLADNTTVDIVMIDTIILCGNAKLMQDGSSQGPFGPENIAAAENQWSWLENQLKASNSDYLFIAGHFPVYSIAEHGPTKQLIDRLLPILYQYNVTAYISGHDHTLQHLRTVKDKKRMNFVVSGAGSKMTSLVIHKKSVPTGSSIFHWPNKVNPYFWENYGGYIAVSINKTGAKFDFFDGHNTNLYSFGLAPRK